MLSINPFKISRGVATGGLCILFPGYLLYHYALAQVWIPPFLGGLFGPVSLLIALLCILLLPWIATRSWGEAFTPGVVVSTTIAYVAVWSIVNFLFIRGESYAANALTESASTVLLWIAMVFVGGFYAFDKALSRKLLIVLGALMVLSLIHAIVRFQSPLGPYLTFSGDDPDSTQSSYQGIGRSILVTAIFLAALVNKTHHRLGLFAVGSLLLLLVGSRSDLFTLVLLTAVLALQSGLKGANRYSTIAAMMGCVILLYFATPLFLNTRSAEIFDLANSSSWQARQDLQTTALGVIRNNPIFGSFEYHMRDDGAGFYAHNALSAWTNFGLVAFILYIGLMISFTLISFRRVRSSDGGGAVWFAAFELNLASLIQALFASPVFSPLPALAWGLTLNALRSAPRESRGTAPDVSSSPDRTIIRVTGSTAPYIPPPQAAR